MADFKRALVELGELLSLLDDGNLDFAWFGGLPDNMFRDIPDRRARVHALLAALLDPGSAPPPAKFDGAHSWYPLLDGPPVGAGLTWSDPGTSPDTVSFGLGAKLELELGTEQVALSVLSSLLEISSGAELESQLGRFEFAGQLPVPAFLERAELSGVLDVSGAGAGHQLTLTATTSAAVGLGSCTFEPFTTAQLGPDLARLGLFVVLAWVRHEAGKGGLFERLDTHLLPLLGVPPSPIAGFPPFDGASVMAGPQVGMGKPLDFKPWLDSLTANDGTGAMTAIWHLRALLTGNEDPSLFGGSCYVPLHSLATAAAAVGADGLLPGLSSFDASAKPSGAGAWLGVRWTAGELAMELAVTDESPWPASRRASAELLRFDPQGKVLESRSSGDLEQVLASLPPEAAPYLKKVGSGPTRLRLDGGAPSFQGPDGQPWELSAVLTVAGNELSFALGLGPVAQAPLAGVRFGPGAGRVEPICPGLDDVLRWLLPASGPLDELPAALGVFVDDGPGGLPQLAQPSEAEALDALFKLLLSLTGGGSAVSFEPVPELELSLAQPQSGSFSLATKLTLRNPEPDISQGGPQLGGVALDLEFELYPNLSLTRLGLDLLDVRLGALGLAGSIGEALPDLGRVQGFDLGVDLVTGPQGAEVALSGGGTFFVQQTIGPFNLDAIHVDLVEEDSAAGADALELSLDGQFELGPVVVAPYGLGLRVDFADGQFTPQLDGLGLSLDSGGLRMSGMFAKIDEDFLGAAVLSVFDLFELSAIGGYTDVPASPSSSETMASLFVFASLVAPLGGPPYCFVTGLAGGFGYNRALPQVDRPSDHPFLQVMKGQAIDTGNMAKSLKELGVHFAPLPGQHWIAAGAQFTSFGFIAGKLVASVGFGQAFRLTLLGSAAFGIEPVAYFEIDFMVDVDEEHFLLTAGLSPNRYLLHRDIFSLFGQFSLAVWYAGDHAGDFLLSIGGFHPYFPVPEHYPSVDRVGVRASLLGIHLEIKGYFALTPRAIMAGAALDLWGEFAGISAGLRAYVDVLFKWDPFFMWGRMGVAVWFEFMGRHELSVDFEFWTPELGGVARIDLLLVSFDIEFGADFPSDPVYLPLADFFSRQLAVPAVGAGPVAVATFASAGQPGLLSLDTSWGRATQAPEQREGQEGLFAQRPLLVEAEFGLVLRSRLAAGAAAPTPGRTEVFAAGHRVGGSIGLPLCGIDADQLTSTLQLSGPGLDTPSIVGLALGREFPAAHYEDPVAGSRGGDMTAAMQVQQEAGKEVSFWAHEGMRLDFEPRLAPASADKWTVKSKEELSTPAQVLPLPLEQPLRRALDERVEPGVDVQRGRASGAVGQLSVAVGAKLGRSRKLAARTAAAASPRVVLADLPPAYRPRRIVGPVATRAERMAVPASPRRRPELAEVDLSMQLGPGVIEGRAARRSDLSLRSAKLSTQARGPATVRTRSGLRPLQGSLATALSDARGPSVTVAAGQAALLDPARARVRGKLVVAGDQVVRALVLNRHGVPVADRFLDGAQSMALPRGANRVLVVGEGSDAPVEGERARESVGVDVDSSLVIADRRCFAARGCTIQGQPRLREALAVLDVLPGRTLLRSLRWLRANFPAVGEDASLILGLRARVREPRPLLEQLDWASDGAALGQPRSLALGRRLALVLPARAPGRWNLQLRVDGDWEFELIAASPEAPDDAMQRLDREADWNLVDDRREPSPGASSTVSLELAP